MYPARVISTSLTNDHFVRRHGLSEFGEKREDKVA